MYLTRRARNVVRGILQAHGTKRIKRLLWNSEFAGGRWDCLDSTAGDFVYQHIEKYAKGGSILDLGCGSGNTGNELNIDAYSKYTGIDVADEAIQKASGRSEMNQRGHKNSYAQSDIVSYVPSGKYNVILFRDSVYYIPRRQIAATLKRYAAFLTSDGVIIIRMYDISGKYRSIVDILETEFNIVERQLADQSQAFVAVLRSETQPGLRVHGEKPE